MQVSLRTKVGQTGNLLVRAGHGVCNIPKMFALLLLYLIKKTIKRESAHSSAIPMIAESSRGMLRSCVLAHQRLIISRV